MEHEDLGTVFVSPVVFRFIMVMNVHLLLLVEPGWRSKMNFQPVIF